MTQNPAKVPLAIPAEFLSVLQKQQAAYKRNMNPSLEERRADLRSLHRMLVDNHEEIVAAINQDYGCRCRFETKFAETYMAQEAALDTIKHLKKWLKPHQRSLDPTQYPLAKAWTFPQPVGVVGIVVPWNFPIAMTFQPLIGVFAAGNRAMIKMSENSNTLALLLKRVSANYFPEDKLAFFEDGGGRGPQFTSLPFDHIFFTGSPATGKAVMANAAKNLTPVTLELGGKSPCVVAPDYPIRTAAERIIWAKMLNAGQICTNVDYLFLPEGTVEEFIRGAKEVVSKRFPDINNGDYTAVIDQRSFDRLQETAADAVAKGAELVDLYSGPAADGARRIMPPRIVINVDESMDIMQREIFGPLLPIMTYKTKEEVVEYVGDRPRPLAFYVYSDNTDLQEFYMNNTISGGVGLNESVIQAGIHNLPFGGIGNSGMGHYHGYEGFITFSKLRPVFKQSPLRTLDLFVPPYKGLPNTLLNIMHKMKSCVAGPEGWHWSAVPAVAEPFPGLVAARACVEEGSSVLHNHWCASVDATIDLRTGCNPLEQHGPQAVIVHADAWAPVAAVADPHDIRQVIDYEVIFLAIRKLEGNPHSICLETSILEVMDAIFSMAIVTAAFVAMHKPHVYNGQGTPAISLSLTREQWEKRRA